MQFHNHQRVVNHITYKSRSLQAPGLLAGACAKPSNVAARLNLADLLLVVLLGTGTSVSSYHVLVVGNKSLSLVGCLEKLLHVPTI